ncbi:MAG: hypothetical protein WAP35_01635 [Solirubrobacterales bacterium]
MRFFSRPAIAVLAAGAALVVTLGATTASGGETIRVEQSAAHNNIRLVRVRLEGETRQGVIEAASGVTARTKRKVDLTVSLHGITPDVTVRLIASIRSCGVADPFTTTVFDVTLPASSNDDRFLADDLDVTQSIANAKSFRILENDVQTGCRKPTIYSARKFP